MKQWADIRRWMSPPHRQSVAEIAQELGIHVITLYKWRKAWRLQGEVVPATQKDPEGWGPTDKFTVVLETAGLNSTELGAKCRVRGLFPEQVDRWRQAAQDANAQPLLTMAEQKHLERCYQPDQREMKRLQQELRRRNMALAEAAALLMASKRSRPTGERTRGVDISCPSPEGPEDPRCGHGGGGTRARALAALLGVGLTTLQRWRRQFAGDGDGLDGR